MEKEELGRPKTTNHARIPMRAYTHTSEHILTCAGPSSPAALRLPPPAESASRADAQQRRRERGREGGRRREGGRSREGRREGRREGERLGGRQKEGRGGTRSCDRDRETFYGEEAGA